MKYIGIGFDAENKMVTALAGCEPEPLLAVSAHSSPIPSPLTQYKSICILSDLVDRELVATIGWLVSIPPMIA